MIEGTPSLEKFGWHPQAGFSQSLRSTLRTVESSDVTSRSLFLGQITAKSDLSELELIVDRLDRSAEGIGVDDDMFRYPEIVHLSYLAETEDVYQEFIASPHTEFKSNGEMIVRLCYNALQTARVADTSLQEAVLMDVLLPGVDNRMLRVEADAALYWQLDQDDDAWKIDLTVEFQRRPQV